MILIKFKKSKKEEKGGTLLLVCVLLGGYVLYRLSQSQSTLDLISLPIQKRQPIRFHLLSQPFYVYEDILRDPTIFNFFADLAAEHEVWIGDMLGGLNAEDIAIVANRLDRILDHLDHGGANA